MKHFTSLLLYVLPFFSIGQKMDSTWMANNYVKQETNITMRDGVKLFTSIYSPKDKTEKHPILMTRTPYSCSPYGLNKMRAFGENYLKEYLKENYIMVIQDVRGRFMSEGTYADIRPFIENKKDKNSIDEASDTYDTIDWLVNNLQENNGNVGVFGISYPGFYSTMAALSNHPALKAVSPQAPVTDWFVGDDFHHNGVFMLMDAFSFYSSFGQPRRTLTTKWPKGVTYTTADNYGFYLQNPTLKGLQKKYFGDSILFWNELMKHPNLDDWWKARTVTNFISNVKPAVLVVGGLFDAEDCYGAWKTYKTMNEKSPSTKSNIVMGPWSHGGWARSNGSKLGNVQFEQNTSEWYQKNIEIPFFNFYLKGKGKIPDLAEATIFFTGENKWRKYDQWPPNNMQPTELFFAKEGKLSWNAPARIDVHQKPLDSNTFSEYTSDPKKPVPYAEKIHTERTREYMTDDQRFASRRTDVLSFSTDELTTPISLGGTVEADLMISTTGSDADFVVKVIDVFPDNFTYSDTDKYIMNGYEMLVRGEIFRGRYRNSFEKPEAIVPNKITRIHFSLPDVAHTFKPGHKIMIQIQSSWFPIADRNPQKFVNIYTANESDFQKATIRIYHNETTRSKMILPIVK